MTWGEPEDGAEGGSLIVSLQVQAPTLPLVWIGAGNVSATGDGYSFDVSFPAKEADAASLLPVCFELTVASSGDVSPQWSYAEGYCLVRPAGAAAAVLTEAEHAVFLNEDSYAAVSTHVMDAVESVEEALGEPVELRRVLKAGKAEPMEDEGDGI